MKRFLILIIILSSITSCNDDDDDDVTCVEPNTLDFTAIQELNSFGLNQVYQDQDYRIFLSSYITPNADGIRDVLIACIEDLNNNSTFVSNLGALADDDFDNISENPNDFLLNAKLRISDNCRELFQTENLTNLTYYPGFPSSIGNGIYKVEIDFQLISGTNVVLNENFEVFKTEN